MTRLRVIASVLLIGYAAVAADESSSYTEASSNVETNCQSESRSHSESSAYTEIKPIPGENGDGEECLEEPNSTEAPTTSTTETNEITCEDDEVLDNCPADCPSDYCPRSEADSKATECTTPEPCPPPKCRCRFNYRRVENGTCIPTRSCPSFECSGENEEFNPCPPLCPTDDCSQATPTGECPKRFGNILIVLQCSPKCRCKKGYWRKNGVCVPYAECNTTTCGENEVLDKCPSSCSSENCPKSEEVNQSQSCALPDPCPPPACKCAFNYRRADNGTCIPTTSCPPFECSRPNEEYNACPPMCPTDDCSQATPNGSCPKRFGHIGIRLICSPKCRCQKGYWRKDGVCRPYADCDKECNARNEEYTLEKSSCIPDTCMSLVAKFNCTGAPPPKPGCTCKSGFLRINSTSPCVPICDCPQMKYSPECTKPNPEECNGPNEEYTLEKPSCPPETCFSMVARYDCRKFPPPQPGCACKSGFLRINATSPCVPICECPEMKNSPDCMKPNPEECKGPNEEYTLEKSSCPPELCSSLVSRYDCSDAPAPKPGCACKSGFMRVNATSPCIPICECPEMKNSPDCMKPNPEECKGPNEEYTLEKPICPPQKCVSLVTRFSCADAPPPKPGCACKTGFLRVNDTSPCVPICECPEMKYSPECMKPNPEECKGPNEEYILEKPSCPPETCFSMVASYDCSKFPPPQPGCACKSGFMRVNDSSPCVPICECPEMKNSPDCIKPEECKGPNEEYTLEKPNCPPELCSSILVFYDCSKFPPPQPGCACKSGFMRVNATSPCVPTCECPQMRNSPDCMKPNPEECKGPNEEYTLEKSSCPPELCSSLVSRYDCSEAPPPQPGCACKSGFKRVNDSSPCMPICECPEMRNSPDCMKPNPEECKGPNEEYTLEKPSCPPELCSSLVSKYDCSDAPPPKPGCACKSGFKRVNATSPCVPICECPEMRHSQDCMKPTEKCCGPNEEFTLKKPTCPPETCTSIGARYDCRNSPPPRPGCACKPGFFRIMSNLPCVPMCDCPQMRNSPECQKPKPEKCCGPNEVYTLKKRTCPPDTCLSMVARYDCRKAPPPQPGCTCKPGFLRLKPNSPCVPKCECPQIKNSPECVEPKPEEKLCPYPNEEYTKEKKSCPPDECFTLVARMDCRDAPPPQPGCVCKSGFLRVNPFSHCIPIEECPQMGGRSGGRQSSCEEND